MNTTSLSPAERVALLIKKLDVSTYQFGKATGISHQTLSNVLTGKNKPGLDTLQSIAAVYPAAAVFLLTGQGEPFADGVRGDKLPSPAVPTPAAEPMPQLTSGAATVDHATELLLREQLLDTVKELKADKARLIKENVELRDENKLLLGKPFDSSDAADTQEDEPTPTTPTPQGALPLPALRVQQVKGLRRYQD